MNRAKMTFASRALILAGMLVLSAVFVAAADPITNWNTIAVQASLTSAQSAGAAASRTLAIVHVAIHDALNAIDSRMSGTRLRAMPRREHRLTQQSRLPHAMRFLVL